MSGKVGMNKKTGVNGKAGTNEKAEIDRNVERNKSAGTRGKRVLGVAAVAAVCVLLACVGHVLSVEKTGIVTDIEGNVIARLMYDNRSDGDQADVDRTVRYDCEDGYEAYIDLACREAAKILCEREGIREAEAFGMLVEEEMTVQTTLCPDVMRELLDVCAEEQMLPGILASERAAAVGDTKGHILACYSHSVEDSSCNYVTYPTYAGSTIKPLSVYGPAVEDGVVCWSDLYMDSAYCRIINADGKEVDWPVNTGSYTNRMWTVQEALKKSNNAIAVKVLKDYGVGNSCRFIREAFGLKTEVEEGMVLEGEEDDVLSNIALGYLEAGVTMRDLLGAYQTFANGGIYTPMHAVAAIRTGNGEEYYQEDSETVRVFSMETAYIMNRMLKTVVEEGGTGEAASIKGLDICGKTGTSDESRDNWFVGMTPEYVCAVWYRLPRAGMKNESPAVFKEIMVRMEHHEEIGYQKPESVAEAAYCEKTGLLANEFCEEQKTGYYKKQNMPGECDCQ